MHGVHARQESLQRLKGDVVGERLLQGTDTRKLCNQYEKQMEEVMIVGSSASQPTTKLQTQHIRHTASEIYEIT